MSLGLWNLQWLNHNTQRSYPIADWASKECNISSDIKLANDCILAVNFAVSCGMTVNIDSFYIKFIALSVNGCSVGLGYNGYDEAIAVTHILLDKTQEVITSVLTGLGDFDDTVGYIAINPNSVMFDLNPGYYTFDYSGTALEPDCIRPMLRGVSSVRIKTAGGYSEKMYGDIVLVAGSNVTLDVVSSGLNGSTIRISAVNNPKYEASCTYLDNPDMPAITTINGVSPSQTGNLTITGASCLSVEQSGNSVNLKDTCAEPCCGCQELNALEAQIDRLATGKNTLEEFLSELIASMKALEVAIVPVKEPDSARTGG